jgi:hypothetical protein
VNPPPSALIRLLYVSTARAPFTRPQLAGLLEQARDANARRGITGALLYHDQGFAQILEGDSEQVDALVARIEVDPRHHGMTTLLRTGAEGPLFPGWSMGWIQPADLTLGGFDPDLVRRAHFGDADIDALVKAFRLCVRLEVRPV